MADITPITDAHRDGRFQLVVRPARNSFALVRWTGEAWEFGQGAPLDFEPTHCQVREGI